MKKEFDNNSVELTLKEFQDRIILMGESVSETTDRWHKEDIEQALFDKKIIREDVLRDYPLLEPKQHLFKEGNLTIWR